MVNPVGNNNGVAAPNDGAAHIQEGGVVPQGIAHGGDRIEARNEQPSRNWVDVPVIGSVVQLFISIENWLVGCWNSFCGLFTRSEPQTTNVSPLANDSAPAAAEEANHEPAAENPNSILNLVAPFNAEDADLSGLAQTLVDLLNNQEFLGSEEARQVVGGFLANHVDAAQAGELFGAVWLANGENDEGEADFGRVALRAGRFFEHEGVQGAIRALSESVRSPAAAAPEGTVVAAEGNAEGAAEAVAEGAAAPEGAAEVAEGAAAPEGAVVAAEGAAAPEGAVEVAEGAAAPEGAVEVAEGAAAPEGAAEVAEGAAAPEGAVVAAEGNAEGAAQAVADAGSGAEVRNAPSPEPAQA